MAAEATVSSSHNVRRIADTWFSTRKHLIYRMHRLDKDDEAADAGVGRSTLIPQQTACRHVDWYLSNVAASVMLTPNTSNPLHFGILQVRDPPSLASPGFVARGTQNHMKLFSRTQTRNNTPNKTKKFTEM